MDFSEEEEDRFIAEEDSDTDREEVETETYDLGNVTIPEGYGKGKPLCLGISGVRLHGVQGRFDE